MNTDRNDYCGGFTYDLVYVSGPFAGDTHPSDPLKIGPDLTLTYSLTTLTYSGTVSTFDWVGVHTFKVVGQNGDPANAANRKPYLTTDSADFTITIVNPCETSTVLDETITTPITTTVKLGTPVKWMYDNNKDSASVTYGDGWNRCDERLHYITDVFTNSEAVPGDLYKTFQFLTWKYFENGDPADLVQPSSPPVYEFTFQSDSKTEIGTYDF